MTRPIFWIPPVRIPQNSIFNNRSFLALWTAQISSQIAVNLLSFILAVVVYEETRSNQSVSFLVISYGLAGFLLSTFAGTYVDYADKKKVMFISNLSRALLVASFLLITHSLSLTIGFVFVLSAITQFFWPAEGATIPEITTKETLLTANSLFTFSAYASQILAYLAGGYVLTAYGYRGSVVIILILFVVAALAVQFASIPHDHVNKIPFHKIFRILLKELHAGLSYIRATHRVQVPLWYLGMSGVIVAVFFSLVPGYAVEVLGIPTYATSAYLIAPVACGMIIGAALIHVLQKKGIALQQIASKGAILAAVGFIAMGLNQRIPFEAIHRATARVNGIEEHFPNAVRQVLGIDVIFFAIIFVFCIGVANAFVVIASNTLLQSSTEAKYRGRVYGVLQMLTTAVALFPIIITGYVADAVSVNAVCILLGVVILLTHAIIRIAYRRSQ